MIINTIFADILYSFIYSKKCQWRHINKCFTSPEYLEQFFADNESDLINGYFDVDNVSDAVYETIRMARDFFDKILSCCENKEELNNLFKFLDSSFSGKNPYPRLKARNIDDKNSWLRIYALKVGEDKFVITGGAIKLTQKMQDRKHTKLELSKLENAKDCLRHERIFNAEDFIQYVEYYDEK